MYAGVYCISKINMGILITSIDITNPKQPSCKKVCGPQEGHYEKRCEKRCEI